MNTINTTIISLSNYLFFYGFRVILGYIRKQNVKLELINRINENFINNESKILTKSNTNDIVDSTICKSNEISDEDDENGNPGNVTIINKSNFIYRMISYHYSTESKVMNTTSLNYDTNTFKQ